MEVVFKRCCGLDIHKKTVVACVLIREKDTVHKDIQTFSTMTEDLLILRNWLMAYGVTHVAMESTGIYWKPVYNLLEDDFTILLVNSAHIKAVPGRKTDVKNCEWIADLLALGLIKGSFILPREIRDLKDLTRYQDLGNNYFERLNAAHIQRHHVRMLERLGLKVALEPLGNIA
jgi:transposase